MVLMESVGKGFGNRGNACVVHFRINFMHRCLKRLVCFLTKVVCLGLLPNFGQNEL